MLARAVRLLLPGAAAALAMAPSSVLADPQGSAALTMGAAGRGYGDDYFHEPAFHVGLRGELMFARASVSDVGIGPYAELLTHAFDEVQMGGGAALLLPVFDPAAFVIGVGPYARYAPLIGWEPGIATSLFFGSRSFNFSSNYALALGLITEARVGLGDSRETSFVFGLQVDAAFAAIPILYLVEAAKGGSRETDRVPR